MLGDARTEPVFGRRGSSSDAPNRCAKPGEYFTATIGEEPVLVVRGSGRRTARDVQCLPPSRRPGRQGSGRRTVLQCGYHGWTYSLDGRLTRTPEFEGVQGSTARRAALPQFRVDELERAGLRGPRSATRPARSTSSASSLTDMPRHDYRGIRLAARKEWELDVQLEGLRRQLPRGLPHPHRPPRPVPRARLRQLPDRDEAPATRSSSRRRGSGRTASAPSDGDDQVRYFWIFPNLMLNVYPDNFSTNLIVPLGPDAR